MTTKSESLQYYRQDIALRATVNYRTRWRCVFKIPCINIVMITRLSTIIIAIYALVMLCMSTKSRLYITLIH